MNLFSTLLPSLHLKKASFAGDLEEVKRLLGSHDTDVLDTSTLNRSFDNACFNGHMDIIMYFLNTVSLSADMDIHHDGDRALSRACEGGHLQVVRHLISLGLSVQANDFDAFIKTCEKGQAEVAQYLLTTPELEVNIHLHEDVALRSFASQGNREMVQYLLTSNDLQEHAHIHAKGDEAFRTAYENAHWSVVNFLLHDMRLTYHPEHYEVLGDCLVHIKSLFEKRDLFFMMNGMQDANNISDTNTTSKVKL